MLLSLSRIIHHSHSFTRLEIYHHNYFKYKSGTYIVDRGEGEYTLNSDVRRCFVEQVGMNFETIFGKHQSFDY